MSAFSDELHRIHPNLSELRIAILEALLDEAVKQAEIASADVPALKLRIATILAPGLEKMETRVTWQHREDDPYRQLLKLPAQNLPLFPDDIWGLYQRSSGKPTLWYVLVRELSSAPGMTASRAEPAVDGYFERLFDEVNRMAAEWCQQPGRDSDVWPVMRILWKARPPAGAKPPVETGLERKLQQYVDVGDISDGVFVDGNHNVVINYNAADGTRAPDLAGILNSGPTETRQRVLEAAIEQQVQVGVAASLFVWIRREDSKSLLVAVAEVDDEIKLDEKNVKARPMEIEFPLRDGKLRAAGILVKLTAPDFAVDSPEKRINVPPEGDSEICTFAVTARKAGRLQLTLEVCRELTTIASRNLYTTALEGVKPAVSAPTGVVIPMIVVVPGVPARPVTDVKPIPPPVQVAGRPAIDEPITGKQQKQPPARSQEGSAQRYCPQCGFLITAGRRFCPNCGTPLGGNAAASASNPPAQAGQAQASYSPPPAMPQSGRSTFSPALTITGLVVLLVAGALFVFGRPMLATPIATATHIAAKATSTVTSGIVTSAPAAVVPDPAWPTVLTDSFNDDQNKWLQTTSGPIIVGGDTQWQARITDDHLYEVSGSTTHAGGSTWYPFLAGIEPLNDFYFAMDVRIVSSSPGDAAALIFGVRDPQSAAAYYTFETKEPDWFRVTKHAPGDAPVQPLLDWKETSAIQPGQRNRFAVLGIGSQFQFFVNGSCVGQVKDMTHPAGIVGVFAQMQHAGDHVTAEFDNAEVRIPTDAGNVRCP